jgi:hypothetical protein
MDWERLGVWLRSVIVAVSAAAIAMSCGQNGESKKGAGAEARFDVVAGYGEQSFTQKYHLHLVLPMPESEFLATLKRLRLRYEIYGERGTDQIVPHPWHSKSIDPNKMERAYQVYGGVFGPDQTHQVSEVYMAYVDTNLQVVYIENEFSYSGL